MSNKNNSFNSLTEEQQLQYQIQKYQLELFRQSSIKSTKHVNKNDLHTKINRFYSKLLVEYHWVFLLIGIVISLIFTGFSFMKQPLPNFLDPTRGFGARGEGTLTSQLIVMKNVNTEITKFNEHILKVYEEKKKNQSPGDDQFGVGFGDDVVTNDGFGDNFGDDESDGVTDESSDQAADAVKNSNSKSSTPAAGQKSRGKRDADHDDKSNGKHEDLIWKQFTESIIQKMVPSKLTIKQNELQNHAINDVLNCNYTLALDKNLEFYFSSNENLNAKEFFKSFFNGNKTQSSDSVSSSSRLVVKQSETNLLSLTKLKSLCNFDKKYLEMTASWNKIRVNQICYFSLPLAIATLNNKQTCDDLTQSDVDHFLEIVSDCYTLHANGILYATAEEFKKKPPIIELLSKNDPLTQFAKKETVQDNLCFKKNLMHIVYEHLVDKEFLADYPKPGSNSTTGKIQMEVKVSSLILFNTNDKLNIANRTETRLMNENAVYRYYLKYFHSDRDSFHDRETQMLGINLMGIRQETAMRLISQEMTLVALAISLIVIVTLLYLKSIFISMIVNLGVGLSVGISFFAYRIVFDIDLFPFINMMAAFLLIGIACDNVYVLFDAWYNEKTRIIMEDLPEMIEKYYKHDESEVIVTPNAASPTDDDHRVPESVESTPMMNDQPATSTNRQNVTPPAQVQTDLPPIFIKQRILANKKNKRSSKSSSSSSGDKLSDHSSKANKDSQAPKSGEKQAFLGQALNNTPLYEDMIDKGIDITEYELNPLYVRLAPLTDEQMIRVMSGTLRHAASSIFVTSFTTAAAFLTNFITKLPYVQLFGVFTGFCILIYFTMVITMIAAFVITYEKLIQPMSCKWRPKIVVKAETMFERIMGHVALIKHRLISKTLPSCLINFRLFWFLLFFFLGVCGLLVVFYKPQLKPPQNWRHQFFENENPFESFEFNIKDQFLAYFNEEKRNLTNPEIFFVFGIMNKDTGRVFNPDDDGHLVYDEEFDFMSEDSQLWLHNFITSYLASRRDLFLVDDIVREWRSYIQSMQTVCSKIFGLEDKDITQILLPFPREKLMQCRNNVNEIFLGSDLTNFENMMAEFPRRIIFMSSNESEVKGLLLRVNANRTFVDYDTVRDYYLEVKKFREHYFTNATIGFQNGWFISVAFALYDLQYQLMTGTYSSLIASMIIAYVILLLTSGNIFISIYAIITISFSIADTIAIFVFMGWDLSILESVVIIMSVGLSVDFSCHYGVAYINSDREFNYDNNMCCRNTNHTSSFDSNSVELSKVNNNLKPDLESLNAIRRKKYGILGELWSRYQANNKERFVRIGDIFERVGSAVLMAAFTTFLAGLSMYPSGLTSFKKMGQFLMLVMFTSYLFATFFFVPFCALFGPTQDFGNLRFKEWFLFIAGLFKCGDKKKKSTSTSKKNIAAAVNDHNNTQKANHTTANNTTTTSNNTSNL